MRKAFFDTLRTMMQEDPSVWLLFGDVGFSVVEPLQEAFPDRALNVGISEQNMVGMAAGLALSGAKVVVYSIGNFSTLRCLEQIRNDVCYHKLPVTIVGVGSGLVYGTQGYTHHIVEDIAVLRALPNMTLYAPADPIESAAATRAALTCGGPAALRLAKAGEPNLHPHALSPADLSHALHLRDGADLTLCATGTMVDVALQAATLLAHKKIEARVLSFPRIAPLDAAAIRAEAARVKLIATLEEHGLAGGFGESVGTLLAETNGADQKVASLIRFGIDPRIIDGPVGTQADLRALFGLTPEAVAEKLMTRLSSGN